MRPLDFLVATEGRRDALFVLMWGQAIGWILSIAFYQRTRLALTDYAILFAVCVAAGAILNDFTKALIGYVFAIVIGVGTAFTLSVFPVTQGGIAAPGDVLMEQLWVIVLFQNLIPIPAVTLFVASIIGAGLGEKYF